MSRSIDDLCPSIRHKVERVLAKLVEAKELFLIVDTLRTPEEQAEYVRRGVSWTLDSKHLPQTDCIECGQLPNSLGTVGLSHAIDLAPFTEWARHGRKKLDWDARNPFWKKYGELLEETGLKWGGRWVGTPDLGHGEKP